jgi:hypothetical protein
VGSQTGAAALQSLALKQPTHRFEVSHTGVGAEQSVLARHATHWFATVSHFGAAVLVQSESAAQTAHDPAFIPVVMHAVPPGLSAQSAFDWHGSQRCVVVSHVGVEPLQSELNSHATHVPVG